MRNAVTGGTVTNANVTANFRVRVSKNAVDFVKYGAAYFPYLETNVPFRTDDASVTLKSFNTVTVADDGSEGYQGFVTDMLRERLLQMSQEELDTLLFYNCGPEPMVHAAIAVQREFCRDDQIS